MKVKNDRIAILVNAMGALDEHRVYQLIDEFISQGVTSLTIQQFLSIGMKLVGEYYQSGEYFLADILYASYIYDKALKRPGMVDPNQPFLGRIVIGTVSGDVHDMARSIVAGSLAANGYQVIDLGADVGVEDFVEAIIQHKPDILALSCMMSTSLDEIKKIHDRLTGAGLPKELKIIVGGNPTLAVSHKQYGADGYAVDAISSVDTCNAIMGAKNNA